MKTTTASFSRKRLEDGDPVTLKSGAKQKYHPGCILDLTIDFAVWCPSCVAPDGSFDPARRCKYCYASGNKMRYPAVHTVGFFELLAALFRRADWCAQRGLPVRCVRLGKKTDAGHPLYREQLITTLEACACANIPPVVPTKFLEFDVKIAKLLMKASAVLMPSLGHDDLEPGAVLWGMGNKARIGASRHYQDLGVRVVPFVLVDPTRELGGPVFAPILEEALETFDLVQLAPIRLRSRKLAQRVLGGWEDLVLPGPNGEPARFEVGGNSARISVRYHESILELVGDNNGRVRLCAHNSVESHCGACFVPGESGSVLPTATSLLRSES